MGIMKNTAEDDLAEIAAAEKAAKKRKTSRAAKIGIAIGIIAVLVITWLIVENFITYSSYTVSEQTDNGTNGDSINMFKGKLIRFSPGGIKYADTDDEVVWDYSLNMSNPTISYSENYGVCYDREGTKLVLFDTEGVHAEISVSLPIVSARVSDKGVITVSVKEDNSNLVWFYDKEGNKLDIEVKNILAGNAGYPLSMDMSPSGEGLAMPLVFVDGGGFKTQLAFYNFGSDNTNDDKLIGAFDYDDMIFPEIRYLSNDRAVAFGDSNVVFFALNDEETPSVKNEVNYDTEIVSVFAGDEHAGVISKAKTGGYLLTMYNDNGRVVDEVNFAFEFTKAEINDGYALIYGAESMLVEKASGYLKYCGEMEGVTQTMLTLGKNKFLQYGDFGTRIIRLP